MITYVWRENDDADEQSVWRVHHNGDWSGDVMITRDDLDDRVALNRAVNVILPFSLLRDVVAESVRSRLIAGLEQATADEILGG